MAQNQGPVLPQVCPYLGTRFDRGTAHLYPDQGNYCYHCKHPATPLEIHQREYCLSSTHPLCEVYLQDETAPFPHKIEIPDVRPLLSPTLIKVLVGLGIVAVFSAGMYLFLFRPVPTQTSTPTRGYTPPPTVTPTILFEFIPDTSGTQADVQSMLNAIEKETEAALYFTQTSAVLTTTNTFVKLPTDTPTAAASKTSLPTRTSTPSPANEETLSVIATRTPFNTPTPVNTRTKTPTATATRTAKVSATKAITNTPVVEKAATATVPASPTSTPVSTATSTTVPTTAPTTAKKPTNTATSRFHAMDQPFDVNGQQFIVHLVKSGENYEILASTYDTTTEVLLSINYNAPSPLWVKSLIVIAPGLKVDDKTIPALQTLTIIDPQVDIESFAIDHDADVALTKLYNNCSDNCRLQNGDWVIIPHIR